jgi:ABC-2 type transport system ATP-binding protein
MPNAVELHNVTKVYGTHRAVDDISFSVEQGEILGIIGPNGAGKSTAVGIIAGLRDADRGTVTVLGKDVKRQRQLLREEVGIQLQEANLQDLMTVEEALRLYSSFYRKPRPWEPLLQQWGLEAKRKDRFGNLSGGQKQRLFICLALLNDPKLIILDELTTGLDPQARQESWDLVSTIREEGATVILVTHFMEEVERLCDRVALIDRGQLRAIGTIADLIGSRDHQRQLTFTLDPATDLSFLETLPMVRGVFRNERSVRVTGDTYLMANVASALAERQIDPPDLAMANDNLEDLFIELTGKDLRD